MPTDLVILTPAQLKELVREAVQEAMSNVQAAPTVGEEWLLTAEAAAYCKMSKRAFLEHVAKGRLKPDSPARPGFKVHRFLRSSLGAFMRSQGSVGAKERQ